MRSFAHFRTDSDRSDRREEGMESDTGKLFIGGISWGTTDDRLREYFEEFGEVVEAVIMRDRTTGRARGFGFVVFADPAVADRVVMDKHMIDGRLVEAKKAVPRRDDQQSVNKSNASSHGSPGYGRTRKIFVGGLPSTVTEAEFKKYFEQFGSIADVVVMYDHNTQRPRGFGFITYEAEDSVDKAMFKTFHELNGKMVEVKRAVPKELSPGPSSIRSPLAGYNNYSPSRFNSFLNAYVHGYSPSSIGSYGMRMDGRLGQLSGGRNGYTSFGPGYGIGMNFEPGLSPGMGGSSNFSSSLAYGRQLSPYYSGNTSSRYNNGSLINYGGVNDGASAFNSPPRSVWGNSGLNYTPNSGSSNAFMSIGSENLASLSHSNVNWGSLPVHAQGAGMGSNYTSRSSGYGTGENSFGLAPRSYGRNTGSISAEASFGLSAYEGIGRNFGDSGTGGSSIYADATWRSTSSELDATGPFGYGLGSTNADVASSGYIGH